MAIVNKDGNLGAFIIFLVIGTNGWRGRSPECWAPRVTGSGNVITRSSEVAALEGRVIIAPVQR
jgi:hypothetical protein